MEMLSNWSPIVLADNDGPVAQTAPQTGHSRPHLFGRLLFLIVSLAGHDCYIKTFALGWYLLAVQHSVAVIDCHHRPQSPPSQTDEADIGLESVRLAEPAALGQDGLPSCFGTYITVLSLILDRPQGSRADQVNS